MDRPIVFASGGCDSIADRVSGEVFGIDFESWVVRTDVLLRPLEMGIACIVCVSDGCLESEIMLT